MVGLDFEMLVVLLAFAFTLRFLYQIARIFLWVGWSDSCLPASLCMALVLPQLGSV
jgi:hypothetical protein